jgi:hypothetical protein
MVDCSRQAGTFEITDEMVAAGVKVLAECDIPEGICDRSPLLFAVVREVLERALCHSEACQENH